MSLFHFPLLTRLHDRVGMVWISVVAHTCHTIIEILYIHYSLYKQKREHFS